jgi:hypothetical protein
MLVSKYRLFCNIQCFSSCSPISSSRPAKLREWMLRSEHPLIPSTTTFPGQFLIWEDAVSRCHFVVGRTTFDKIFLCFGPKIRRVVKELSPAHHCHIVSTNILIEPFGGSSMSIFDIRDAALAFIPSSLSLASYSSRAGHLILSSIKR